ncbi:MAG TPA: DNA repair exonuclease [Pirellulales bacterium]|jgi:DNA repair exonuclease SbcCD nuclease subunit|nr:DNA repair exonuclease [Pirellulales bacterium]
MASPSIKTKLKFVHAADVHLDSPLRGLEEYAGAPVERLRVATRQAMNKLVQICLDEQVDFLLVAGDLFDTDVRSFDAALWAAAQLQKLHRAGIPVYLILGNHDSRDEMTRQVPWPPNVTLFDHHRPETVRHATLPVAVHGMSYAKREVTQNLVPHFPPPLPNCFNIGLLHTNAGGNPNHDAYAPCGVEELVAKGYDYWALGHVHDYQILHEQPHVVYAGNTQGRHARELGAKGCVLVGVTDGETTSVEFRETDVLRWYGATIILEPDDDEDILLDRTTATLTRISQSAAGRFAAVRLTYQGRSALHARLMQDATRQQIVANVRGRAGDLSEDVWIEKIKFQTRSLLDVELLRAGQDLVGELLRDLKSIAEDPERLAGLAQLLGPLRQKLAVGDSGLDRIDLDDPGRIAGWLREAESLLLCHLVEGRS